MVNLKFKIILIVFFALILLAISAQDAKAVYISSGASCGPYTCYCKNIFGVKACEAVCNSSDCGARCKCGPLEAKCEVLWCGPYHTCINDVHYFNPKCVSISWSSGITCKYAEVEPCTDYWTDDYRCSGSYLQRLYIERICGKSTCIKIETWKNYQYCGSDYCGDWSSNYCKDNDVYHKRTCHNRGCANKSCYDNIYTQEEKVQECGNASWTDNYRCLGNWRQREWINRGCSAGSCYKTSEWRDYQDCGTSGWLDEYQCSGDTLQRKWANRGCSGSSCYETTEWRDYQDCGTDSCGSWSSNYCKNNDVYHSRTCYDRGCVNEACYENPFTDEDKVQECGSSTWLDEYRCSGNWRQRQRLIRGCSGRSCYEITRWEDYQNCAATCFPEVLNEGCKGGTYICKDGMCGFPLQSCSPPQYTDSGVACECNTERGTVIRACNGSGSCLSAEERCDVDCGADLACQGLKPGDEYPGDPSKICCKGEGVKIRLPEWYEAAP